MTPAIREEAGAPLVTHGTIPDRIVASLALIVAAAVVVSTLGFVWQSTWPGPARDFWFIMPMIEDFFAGENVLDQLYKPYGGHRIFFPKLLYLADYQFFAGTNTALIAGSVVLQAFSAALLIRSTWREADTLAPPVAPVLTALTLTLLFSATQIENFIRGWNIVWGLTLAAEIVSLLALVRARDALASGAPAGRWLTASVLAAAFATFTMANGLIAVPILLLVGVGLRFPMRWILGLALAGVVIGGVFLMGYPSGAVVQSEALASPLALLAWLTHFLGMPLSSQRPAAGAVLGAGGLLGAAAFWLHFLRQGRRARGIEIVHLGLLAAAVGTGVAIAFGRMGRPQITWDDGRYQTFVMVFWLSLLALALLNVAGRSEAERRWRRALLAAVALWTLGVVAPAHLRQARSIGDLAIRIRAAHDAIVVGISERGAYAASLSLISRQPKGPDQVARHVSFLRRRRLGMFATARAALLGLRVGTDLKIAEAKVCDGRLIGLHRFEGDRDTALFGSLARGGTGFGRRTLLVSDPSGRIVGLGSTTSFAALENVDIPSEPDTEDWIAFARTTVPPAPFSVWVLVDSRAVCRLSGPVSLGGES